MRKIILKSLGLLFMSSLLVVGCGDDDESVKEDVVIIDRGGLEKASKTIIAPDGLAVGTTFEIEGTTYTVVDDTTIRFLIKTGSDPSVLCTTNVTDMSDMFNGTSSFNQDLSSWNVSSVSFMSRMFYGASSFDQDISGWNFRKSRVTNFEFDTNTSSSWTANEKPNFDF